MAQPNQQLLIVVRRQPTSVHYLLTGLLRGWAADNSLTFGVAVGKALFHVLH